MKVRAGERNRKRSRRVVVKVVQEYEEEIESRCRRAGLAVGEQEIEKSRSRKFGVGRSRIAGVVSKKVREKARE